MIPGISSNIEMATKEKGITIDVGLYPEVITKDGGRSYLTDIKPVYDILRDVQLLQIHLRDENFKLVDVESDGKFLTLKVLIFDLRELKILSKSAEDGSLGEKLLNYATEKGLEASLGWPVKAEKEVSFQLELTKQNFIDAERCLTEYRHTCKDLAQQKSETGDRWKENDCDEESHGETQGANGMENASPRAELVACHSGEGTQLANTNPSPRPPLCTTLNMAGVTLHLYTVDAFTDVPFKGNPAAVCPLPSDVNLDDGLLQKIAMEMNLSETAFIKLLDKADSFKGSNTFGLRWFSTKEEFKLCGHATLASAAVLFGKLDNKQDRIVFKTLSGDLIVKREGEWIHMDFPVGDAVKEDQSQHEQLVASLGDVLGVSDIVYCDSLRYLLVRLHDGWSREEFESWTPDISAMERSTDRLVLLIVTTRGPPGDGYESDGGSPYDFVSRCFVPWDDIPEDPVTGSAQTVLAHYWAQQLGKNNFLTRQCSSRGGEIVVKLRGDRVELLGKAVFVMDAVMKL